MSYKVTIERTEVRTVIQRPEWAKVGEKEVERSGAFFSSSGVEPRTRIEPVMGYTPEIEVRKEITEKVLEVQVDSLDLPGVVSAVLGMEGGAK